MENPNAERDQLLSMMADFDRGVDVDAKYGQKPEQAETDKPETKVETPEAKTEKKPEPEPQKAPEPGKDDQAKSSLTKEQPKAPESEAKPKSKWAAEQERKQKTWEQINAEKAAIKAERERLEREREELQKRSVQKPDDRLKDEHNFTADDYRKFAEANAEADPKLAFQAVKRAQELERRETEARQKAQADELNRAILAKYNELATKNPALKDQNSEDWKNVSEVLKNHPLLLQHPNGLEYAVKAVELERKARDSETKDSKIKQLTDELESLKKKLAIGSGVPSEPPKAEKSFDEMSLEEQRKHLERVASKADRDAGWIV